MKDLKEVLREGNSTTNQRIKQRFIDQHVNANVNSMVGYILSRSYEGDDNVPFCVDDMINMFTLPEYNGKFASFEGGNDEDRQEEIERLESLLNDSNMTGQHTEGNNEETEERIKEELNELNELESEPQDIMEYWLVSSYLLEKLQELGHPVIEGENIWGRCTSGQAILLDHSITQICADMGILDGQENSWA